MKKCWETNPFDVLHSKYAEGYVLGKIMLLLSFIPRERWGIVLLRLQVLIQATK